ncbi:hypothetical protein [Commensalibacter nepenthis]|uniref:Uncharacterized protein n=1 Tax=Commensalibacter nepenthis TaxID=3043872 RepID=A0ABT6QAR8_9PROT|nr:hypothetical protein [Commensalibacter sp. TBRC 10068]MDI2113881.1 hypothetical protein [Commensalibacter sp. TBRC 10068]
MFKLSKISISILTFITLSCMQAMAAIACVFYLILAIFFGHFFKFLFISIEMAVLVYLIHIGLKAIDGGFSYRLIKSIGDIAKKRNNY